MADNFRIHTDANYRIRDDIAPLMQSSRYFNKNNCMNTRSLRRNIISDHFVQPYTKNFDDVITFAKEIKKHIVITRGEKGAISIIGDEITEIKANKNLTIKDLTGAGDLFAAGYLHGFINNLPTEECLEQATKLSSKVIQQIGARL